VLTGLALRTRNVPRGYPRGAPVWLLQGPPAKQVRTSWASSLLKSQDVNGPAPRWRNGTGIGAWLFLVPVPYGLLDFAWPGEDLGEDF